MKLEAEIGEVQPQAPGTFPRGLQLSQQQNGTLDPREAVLSMLHPRKLRTLQFTKHFSVHCAPGPGR